MTETGRGKGRTYYESIEGEREGKVRTARGEKKKRRVERGERKEERGERGEERGERGEGSHTHNSLLSL